MYTSETNGFGLPSLFEGLLMDSRPFLSASRVARKFPLDIMEGADSYVIKADLPGVSRDQIELVLEDQQLRLNVKQTVCKDESCGKTEGTELKTVHRERESFEMSRLVELPHASSEMVEAELKDGVLTVTVKKDETKRVRRIAIK